MVKKRGLFALLLPLTVSLVGCPERSAVWVEPGSTANHLVIGIGETAHGPPSANLYGLTVVRCGDESRLPGSAIWAIARVSESSVPTSILYGSTPPGFETRVPAQGLTTGCYRVQDSGSGSVSIDVDASGAVRTK